LKRKMFILVAFAFITANAFTQQAFDYLRDSLVNVLAMSTIVQVADFEYKEGGSLWGTYLESGKTLALYDSYDGGVEYLILAAAHNLRSDIDLKVYEGRNTSGTVIARDVALDATPMVRFTPRSSGYYCFELINSSNSPAFVSLVVLKYRRNANFSFYTLVEALDNTLFLAEAIAETLPPSAEIPANKWTLFGGNVNQGSSTGYYNAQFQRGGYYLIGAGERSVNDLDVEVIEQRAIDITEGRVISLNTGTRLPIDYGIFAPNVSKYHNLKVTNRSSARSSAFMFGFIILAVKD